MVSVEGGETPSSFERKIEAAIAEENEGATIVTKFLVVAEVVDSDGNRFMHSISSNHCYEWDQLGMMESHRMFWLRATLSNGSQASNGRRIR